MKEEIGSFAASRPSIPKAFFAWVGIAALCVACSSGDGASAPAGVSGAGGADAGHGASQAGGESGASGGSGGVHVASGGTGPAGGAAGAAQGGSGGALPGRDAGARTDGSTTGQRSYSTDRSAFFGASRCPADLELCDDFEAGTIDAATWESAGTAPVVDAVHAARGGKSLHAHANGNGFSYLRERRTFPAPSDRYFGRLFVYIDALPTAPQWAHWTLVGANGASGGGEIRVGGQYDGKTNRFGVGTDGGPTGDWTFLDGDPPNAAKATPEQQWVCLEWLHDGTADETRFFWDGVEHASLHTTSSLHGHGTGIDPTVPYQMPDFTSVWVGWWLYQGGSTPGQFDVWIDSVAIDDERIGCDY